MILLCIRVSVRFSSDAGYWHGVDPSCDVVCDLGIHLDCELMNVHNSKVVSFYYHQLRRIRQVLWFVWQDVAQQLVSAFILLWLDYCNSLLSCLSGSTIQPLQRVMNAAARVVMNLSLLDHVKPALKQLHWLLPVEQRITYKLCLFMHHVYIGKYQNTCQTVYPQLLQPVADTSWGWLA